MAAAPRAIGTAAREGPAPHSHPPGAGKPPLRFIQAGCLLVPRLPLPISKSTGGGGCR